MRRKGSVHLAGIVPVIRSSNSFRMDWHDCLMPIAPGYTALEHSIYECAMAGCHTIWVIASEDVSPLARKRIGDYVQDPVFLGRKGKYPSKDRRPVPIFYVPLKDRYQSSAWALIEGCLSALDVSSNISKWLEPERFYISFPQGVYDVNILREHRQAIKSEENLLLSVGGRTVRQGEYLGFTMSKQDIRKGIDIFKDVENKYLFSDEGEKSYSEDAFSLDNILSRVIIDESEQVELPFYGRLDNWDDYCSYLSSDHRRDIKHPGKLVISYREWNPVGLEN